MRILLAHCDFAPASLALLNLKSYALADPAIREGVEISVVGGTPLDPPDQTVEAILGRARDFRPDLVGFSIYIWSRYRLYEATRRVRELLPGVPIVWGGPDVSDEAYARELLVENPAVDVIVRDEGEKTFAALLRHHLGVGEPLAAIPGCTYRDRQSGALVTNPPVAFLDNLDDIPSLLDLPEVEAIIDKIPVFALETFRGCYMGCAYCYWGGTTRRSFSMDRVFSDLGRILAHRNIKKIWFFDSMFGYKKAVAKELLRFIVANKAPDQSVTFFPNLDFLDEELCSLMKAAGVYIEAGIQTTNEDAYEYLNRKWDKRFLDSKIPLLKKYGLHANAQQLILGLPGDHIRGFRESVDYAFHTRPEAIQIFPFSVLPATGYWKRREEFRLKYEGQYRIVYDSTTFPEDDMIKGGLIMVGTKWYERFPGLAQQLVALLGIPPHELFENMGRRFMAEVWHLEDSPETRPLVRRRLLCQAFETEDANRLDLDLLVATFDRHYGGRRLEAAFDELVSNQAYLNCDELLDARVLPRERVAEALADWERHPRRVGVQRAAFNVFDVASLPEEDRRRPIEFVAHPVDTPKDFFGKDLVRYRVIILGDEGAPSRQPEVAKAAGS
jgi:radical SAM superfamily enzyme YgiQ (UPF0313 family)